MRKSLASRKYYIAGFIAAFVLTCIIVAGAIFICRNVEPGKIIPKDITSRDSKFDEDIIGRTAIEAEDCIRFKEGGLDKGIILDDYIDPFYFIGTVLPEGALESYFFCVYLVKLGLAGAFMYSFLRRRLALKRTFAILMGIAYAVSSRVVFVASLSQALNVVILIPVALSVLYGAARERSVRSYSMVGIIAFLMCASGTAGTLSGTLFIFAASFIISLVLQPSVGAALMNWARTLIFSAMGICCALGLIIPRFISYGITYDAKQVIEDRRVYYSFFDLLSTAFSGVGGSLDYSAVPTIFFGLLPIILIIMFFFNKKIAARVKFFFLLLIALTHISCSASVADLTLTFFGYSSVVTDVRLIGLYAIGFFLGALCLTKLDGLSDRAVLVSGAAPVIAIIIFNGLGGAVSYNITSLFLPAAALLVLTVLIYRFRADFLPRKMLYPFLALGLVLISFNTFIIYSTGSVEPGDVSSSFRQEPEYNSNQLISDRDMSIFNSEDEMYLLIPAKDSSIMDPSILPVYMNSVSRALCGQDLFDKREFEVISEDQVFREEDGYFTADSDSATLVIRADNKDKEELYVYCGFDGANYLEEDDGETVASVYIDGAFLKQITRKGKDIDITVGIDDRPSVTAPIELLALNVDVMDKIRSSAKSISSRSFAIDKVPESAADHYLLTNIPYDDSYQVYVAGQRALTYSVQNMLVVRVEGAGQNVEVRITKGSQGVLLGVSLSLISAALFIGVAVCGTIYENRKKNIKFHNGTEDIRKTESC